MIGRDGFPTFVVETVHISIVTDWIDRRGAYRSVLHLQ